MRLGVTPLIGLLLVGCGGTPASSVPATTAAAYTMAYRGLCAARRQANDDAEAARRSFYDRSHATLHDLTRAVERHDRALAGRVLERMQAVERDLATGAASLAPDIAQLQRMTASAVVAIGLTRPTCRS